MIARYAKGDCLLRRVEIFYKEPIKEKKYYRQFYRVSMRLASLSYMRLFSVLQISVFSAATVACNQNETLHRGTEN